MDSLKTLIEGSRETPALFDTILDRVRPLESQFDILLLTGDLLRFRHVVGRAAINQIGLAARRFAEDVNEGNAPSKMRPFLSADRETRVWCHILASLNLDGGGDLEFLQLQHFAPLVFEDLLEKFKTEMVHISDAADFGAIEAAKKGSGSLSRGGTGS